MFVCVELFVMEHSDRNVKVNRFCRGAASDRVGLVANAEPVPRTAANNRQLPFASGSTRATRAVARTASWAHDSGSTDP